MRFSPNFRNSMTNGRKTTSNKTMLFFRKGRTLMSKDVNVKKKSKIRGSWFDRTAMYFMLLPGVLLLVLFQYLPKFGIVLAFKKYRYDMGILGSEWCGLDNFKYFFKTPDAWLITRNTIAYNLVFIILGLVLAVTIAILFNELASKYAAKAYQTIVLMPHFLSYVVVACLVFSFLSGENGMVNKTILPALGKNPINWYGEPKYWPYILTFVKMWKTIGYNSIVYLAAIAGINKEYYEAAEVDGANKWQQIFHITLPGIRTMMSIMTIMAFGGIINSDFGLFYQVPMNSGLLNSTTSVLGTYIYNSMSDVGFSTAAGVYVSVVGFLMILFTNWIAKKIDPESSLF